MNLSYPLKIMREKTYLKAFYKDDIYAIALKLTIKIWDKKQSSNLKLNI